MKHFSFEIMQIIILNTHCKQTERVTFVFQRKHVTVVSLLSTGEIPQCFFDQHLKLYGSVNKTNSLSKTLDECVESFL